MSHESCKVFVDECIDILWKSKIMLYLRKDVVWAPILCLLYLLNNNKISEHHWCIKIYKRFTTKSSGKSLIYFNTDNSNKNYLWLIDFDFYVYIPLTTSKFKRKKRTKSRVLVSEVKNINDGYLLHSTIKRLQRIRYEWEYAEEHYIEGMNI